MVLLLIGFFSGILATVVAIIALACYYDGKIRKFGKLKPGSIWAKYPLSSFDTDKIEYKYIVDAKPDRRGELELLVLDCDENGDCKSEAGSSPRRIYATRLVESGYEFCNNINEKKRFLLACNQ